MAQFSGTLLTLQSDVTSVMTTQGEMKTDMAAVFQRLDEAENQISELEDGNGCLMQLAKTSAKECSELRESVSDLANGERRFNVWLFGLKEESENKLKLREHVHQLFYEALGVVLAKSELQMVHRSYYNAKGRRPTSTSYHPLL